MEQKNEEGISQPLKKSFALNLNALPDSNND